MKFYFNGGGYTELLATLRAKGHTVVSAGKHGWLNNVSNPNRWKEYNKRILLDHVRKEKPDVYVCSKGFKQGKYIDPAVNMKVKNHVGLSVYWSQDDPFFVPHFLRLNMYKGYDVALSCTSETHGAYKRVGVTPYLFWPAWDSMHRKIEPLDPSQETDLIFAGTPYGCTDIPRKDIVLWAISAGLRVKIYGSPAWLRPGGKRNSRLFTLGDPVLKKHYHGYFSDWGNIHNLLLSGKLTFSNHVTRGKLYLNDRVFLAMGAGCPLVLDHNPGIEKVFTHNKNIILYENFGTLKNRVMYYVKHAAIRKKIGENARAFILQNHTYKHRARQLIQIANNHGIK